MQHVWDRWLDTFSALVIYLSLVALGKDPGLWLALYNSKNLLFAKNDFFPPFTTEAWKQLAALADPQVDELARKLQECCDPLWVCDRSLEATLEQPAAAPAPPPVPADQRWWENRPASGPRLASSPRPAVASPSRAWPQTPPPGSALPAPPPLSAPLGKAGTGPMPQLSQQMVPPSDTIWWTRPPAGQAQPPASQAQGSAGQAQGPARAGYPGYHGSGPSAPMPQGYAPRPPVPAPPGPPAPGPSAPATRTQTGPVVGALALALGILLLAIGAAGGGSIVVIGGLVAAAWGMWRLVTATGKGGKPPGPNSRG